MEKRGRGMGLSLPGQKLEVKNKKQAKMVTSAHGAWEKCCFSII